jgi:alpha-glucoside transport system permease protein
MTCWNSCSTLVVNISSMLTSHALDWDLLLAAAFLAMIVPLAICFSLQRYFVRGLVAGSLKT